jgi:2-oxoglutarate ferredoxin oxidoreductase subunit alpha
MERLLKKFETAKAIVPRPIRRTASQATKYGAIFYGSTSPAMAEALDLLEQQGIALDTLRVRAFPFHDDVAAFIAEHDKIFVVEQNRDAQLRMLVMNEIGVDPAKLIPVLHYGGTPVTASFIQREITETMARLKIVPLRKAVP